MFALQLIARVLINEALDTFLEVLNRSIAPPLPQITGRIILPALIVECMSKFVAHHHAHGTKIQAFRVIGVIEWRL